jgi:hypothetical protein
LILVFLAQALQAVKADPASSEEALRGPREENERLREKLLELEMHTVDILEVRSWFFDGEPATNLLYAAVACVQV